MKLKGISIRNPFYYFLNGYLKIILYFFLKIGDKDIEDEIGLILPRKDEKMKDLEFLSEIYRMLLEEDFSLDDSILEMDNLIGMMEANPDHLEIEIL